MLVLLVQKDSTLTTSKKKNLLSVERTQASSREELHPNLLHIKEQIITILPA